MVKGKYPKVHEKDGNYFVGIGLVTDLVTDIRHKVENSPLISSSIYSREINSKNPSQPVNPSLFEKSSVTNVTNDNVTNVTENPVTFPSRDNQLETSRKFSNKSNKSNIVRREIPPKTGNFRRKLPGLRVRLLGTLAG